MSSGFESSINWNTIQFDGELDDRGEYNILLDGEENNGLPTGATIQYKAYALINGEYVFGETFSGNTGNVYQPPKIIILEDDISTTGVTGTIEVFKYNGKYGMKPVHPLGYDFGLIYKVGDFSNMYAGQQGIGFADIKDSVGGIGGIGGSSIKFDFEIEGLPPNSTIFLRSYVKYDINLPEFEGYIYDKPDGEIPQNFITNAPLGSLGG